MRRCSIWKRPADPGAVGSTTANLHGSLSTSFATSRPRIEETRNAMQIKRQSAPRDYTGVGIDWEAPPCSAIRRLRFGKVRISRCSLCMSVRWSSACPTPPRWPQFSNRGVGCGTSRADDQKRPPSEFRAQIHCLPTLVLGLDRRRLRAGALFAVEDKRDRLMLRP
jgi:hypothetical protein